MTSEGGLTRAVEWFTADHARGGQRHHARIVGEVLGAVEHRLQRHVVDLIGGDDPRAPLTAEPLDHVLEFLEHDRALAGLGVEDALVVDDLGPQRVDLLGELQLLERRQPAELHVEDVGRLDVGQAEFLHQSAPGLGRVL